GFQVPLGEEGEILERAKEIEVPFRLYNFTPDPNFKIILQFGALADQDAGGFENTSLLVEREIYPSSANHAVDSSSPFKLGRISLTDEDRRKLQNARYMRILLVNTVNPVSGLVLIAPPIVRGAGFRPIVVRGDHISAAPDGVKAVSAAERIDAGLRAKYGDTIDRLHPDNARQRVIEVAWKNLDPGESAGIDGRTSAIPLSNYRVLSFFVKGPVTGAGLGDAVFRFILARGPASLGEREGTALDVRFPAAALSPGEWSKVEIRYGGKDQDVFVNGNRVESSINCRPEALRRKGSEAPGMGNFSDDGSGGSGYAAAFLSPAGGKLPDGKFSLDEIILEDPSPSYRLNAGSTLEWTRPGALITYGGTTVLSDLVVSTSLESGVRGDPFTPRSEKFIGALSRSRAETTFLGAKLSSDISFLAASDYAYWSAGHGVSRAWGPFSLEETFSTAPYDLTMTHGFSVGWTTRVYSLFAGDLSYENEKLLRRWKTSLGFTPFPENSSGISLDTDWRWTENTGKPAQWMPNYAETWTMSWYPLLPDSGKNAAKRDAHGLFKATVDTVPVGAEFSLDGLSNVSQTNNTTQSATTGRLDFPFIIGRYQGMVRGERYFMRNLFYSGENFGDDSYKYAESLRDSPALWFTPPIYSFFNRKLEDTLIRVLKNSDTAPLTERGRFTDKMAFSLQFPSHYGLSALILPSTFQAQIDRTLEQKLDTHLDLLNTGATLGFSAINLFGAFGVRPLFNFYESDEFSHSLGGAVAIPKGEDVSWRTQAEQSMAFHGFLGAVLSLTNTVTVGTTGWLESLSVDWTAPVKKNLLGLFYAWMTGKVRDTGTWPALSRLAASEYERLRKETLELVIDNSTDYTQFSIILGHESIIRVLGRLYLSVFAKVRCDRNEETDVFSFLGTIGTTLNITF
ncbi:MAG: hypothetical protein LBP32_08140, partial [Spirochaetaceae bacterium]|nr:hypothetical protein [Spirochaetaceae bacterium]